MAVRRLALVCAQGRGIFSEAGVVASYVFFCRGLRNSISHFLVGPTVRLSVRPSITKLFKRRYTQSKHIFNIFECIFVIHTLLFRLFKSLSVCRSIPLSL